MNLAKNEDWIVALALQVDYTDYNANPVVPNIQTMDITGSTFLMQIRVTEEDLTALVSVSTDPGDGIVITNAFGGQFQITISIAKAARLDPGQYVADLVRIDPNGLTERVFECQCTVVDGTSRQSTIVTPSAQQMRAQQMRARSVRR
jgi:hypothetical protein